MYEHILRADDRQIVYAFSIQNIYSELEIGNELEIEVRQTSRLGFIEIDESRGYSEVYINTLYVEDEGEYELVVESFDSSSYV